MTNISIAERVLSDYQTEPTGMDAVMRRAKKFLMRLSARVYAYQEGIDFIETRTGLPCAEFYYSEHKRLSNIEARAERLIQQGRWIDALIILEPEVFIH